MKDKYVKLKDTMSDMFLDGNFIFLELDDYQVMWEALMLKWEIEKPENWEEFLDEINCLASNKYEWFTETFIKYFNN